MAVAAYHITIANYGFWLPERSARVVVRLVRSWELYMAGGPATKVTVRDSVAPLCPMTASAAACGAPGIPAPRMVGGCRVYGASKGEAVVSRLLASSSHVPAYAFFACAVNARGHTHLVIDRPPYPGRAGGEPAQRGRETAEVDSTRLASFCRCAVQERASPNALGA